MILILGESLLAIKQNLTKMSLLAKHTFVVVKRTNVIRNIENPPSARVFTVKGNNNSN